MNRRIVRALGLLATIGLGGRASAAGDSNGFFDDFRHFLGHRWYVSDGWVNGGWQDCSWTRHNVAVRGGILTLRLTPTRSALRDYQCAELQSKSRLGYGTYEARMRAARGGGLVSAFFTYSGRPATPVHDELDFEVLGRNPQAVQTNFFVNGRGDRGKAQMLGKDGSQDFVTYAVEWTPKSLRWFVDGKLVRTDNGAAMPSTAGKMYLSLWNASAAKRDWAGTTDRARLPASVEFDWVAFTPSGRRCLFPQSITCRK